jgi:hypothetical protein
MATKISKKITGYAIKKDDVAQSVEPTPVLIKRDDVVHGTTYKIKPPSAEHALYVTINSQNGKPIEMFINSQNVEHYQWVQTITRLVSAIFRKGGDVSFVADELAVICDPNGGYWGKDYVNEGKKKFYSSVIAEIGAVLKDYSTDKALEYPNHATPCSKCKEKSVVIIDGCPTCLNCGDSKCG